MHSHMERPWPETDLLLVWQKCESTTLSSMSIHFLLSAAGLGKRIPRTDHSLPQGMHTIHTHSKQPSVFGLWEETGVPRQKTHRGTERTYKLHMERPELELMIDA